MQYIILHILGSELSQGIGSNDYGSQEDLDLQLTIWKADWIVANPSSNHEKNGAPRLTGVNPPFLWLFAPIRLSLKWMSRQTSLQSTS